MTFKPAIPAGVGLLLLAVVSAAAAQAVGDSVSKKAGGKLEIKVTAIAPSACYSKGAATAGAPSGERKVDNTLAVTFTLQNSGAVCAQVLTPLAFSIEVDAVPGAQAALVYIADPSSNGLTARALAVPK